MIRYYYYDIIITRHNCLSFPFVRKFWIDEHLFAVQISVMLFVHSSNKLFSPEINLTAV